MKPSNILSSILFRVICCVAASAIVSLSPRCFAQQRQRPQTQPAAQILDRIRANDTNGDGKISKDEASPQLERFFDRIDANSDAIIDETELKAFAQRMRKPRRPGASAAMPVPENVTLRTDIAYREGNEKWKLDLTMPKEPGTKPRPAIVFVHGGGWRSGDKGGGQWRAMPLEYAAKGYVCISVNYRLTDEAPFPACVEDVKCAVRWLRAHAKEYHVDPDRIGAYGNSAGAHLVAMLGLVPRDAGLEGDGPYQDQSSLVQAVCCSATPTDFSNWGGPDRPFRGAGTFLAGPPETLDQRKKQASPISYVRRDAPPLLIVHGTADRTVPFSQGERFAAALKAGGAQDVTFLQFDGAGHGVFGQHANETHPAMQKFFARTLHAE